MTESTAGPDGDRRSDDPLDGGEAVACAALRAFLHAERPEDVVVALQDAVRALGGVIVPARDADADALQVDVSVGLGEPLLPSAPAGSAARARLERHVPILVADARQGLDVAARTQRLASEMTLDPLTRIGNRAALERLLPRLTVDDVLVAIDLDDFKETNDTHGHAAGDEVLVRFAACLQERLRVVDHALRIGGDEFVLVLVGADSDTAASVVARIRDDWERVRPYPVGFSAGISAWAGSAAGTQEEADSLLYRAKAAGSDLTSGPSTPPAGT